MKARTFLLLAAILYCISGFYGVLYAEEITRNRLAYLTSSIKKQILPDDTYSFHNAVNVSYGVTINQSGTKNIFRSIYDILLPTDLPENVFVKKVELKYTGNSNTSFRLGYISNYPGNPSYEDEWDLIENSIFLGNYVGSIANPYTQEIPDLVDLIQTAHNNQTTKIYLSFRTVSELLQTGQVNFSEVRLIITYEKRTTYTFKNNFEEGELFINGNEKSSGYTNKFAVGTYIQVEAIEPQYTTSPEYTWIWNDTEAPNFKSDWRLRNTQGVTFYQSYNQSYSHLSAIEENNFTLIAYLRKNLRIDQTHNFEFDATQTGQHATWIVEQNSGNVTAPTSKTVNGKQYIFGGWTDNFSLSNSRTYSPQDNTTLTALYKYPNHSNQTDAYASNSQRKFIRVDNALFSVYESMGNVYLEKSTNNGNYWYLLNDGKPLNTTEAIAASIEYLPAVGTNTQRLAIVFQEKVTSQSYDFQQIKIVMYDGKTDAFVAEEIVSDYYNIGLLFPERLNPVIAVLDNGYSEFIVVIWEDDHGNDQKVLVYRGAEYYSGDFYWHNNDPEVLSLTVTNPSNPTVVTQKSPYDNNIYLAWQENISSTSKKIYYAWLQYDGYGYMDYLIESEASSGSGYNKNYNPSITYTLGTPYIAWIGEKNLYQQKEPGISKSSFDEPKEYKALYRWKTSNNWSVIYSLGNNVYSPSINVVYDNGMHCDYAIVWSENNGQSNKGFLRDREDDKLFSLNTAGKFIQLNNGGTLEQTFVNAFNVSSSPYAFTSSDPLTFYIGKESVNPMQHGRSGVISIGSSEFYYTIGDVFKNGNSVLFTPIDDSLDVNTIDIIGDYVHTENIHVNNETVLTYSVMFGVTDSLEADNIIQPEDFLTFVLQVVDAETGDILGILEEVTYTKANLGQYALLSYEVSMNGIGNKEVKLQLKAVSNRETAATLGKLYADSEVLLKSNPIKKTYNGAELVEDYALSQNYPNPFNPATTINYQIPADGFVTLKVYDILGKEVATLVNEQQTIGRYSINFNATHFASGVYIYELRCGEFIQSKKMMLLR